MLKPVFRKENKDKFKFFSVIVYGCLYFKNKNNKFSNPYFFADKVAFKKNIVPIFKKYIKNDILYNNI